MSVAWDAQLHICEKSHLRIFLSADIVGSTAFKQRASQVDWFSVVLSFYKLSEQTFADQWSMLAQDPPAGYGPDKCGEAPELWKTIGDEVLFTKRIDHPGQAILCLHAWVQTLEVLRKKLRQSGLDVKSTAWVAEFPLTNQEIVLFRKTDQALAETDQMYIRQNHENLVKHYEKTAAADVLIDYIGPSIDTGFRLGSFSSPRKLVVSVELAYVLGAEQVRDNKQRVYSNGLFVLPDLIFKFEGRFSLKGVLSGDPYPIIWLDLDPDNELVRAEEAVLKLPRPTAVEIQDLAKAYIGSHNLLSVPYIDDCEYREYTDNQNERRALLVNRHVEIQKMARVVQNEKELDIPRDEEIEADPPMIRVSADDATNPTAIELPAQ